MATATATGQGVLQLRLLDGFDLRRDGQPLPLRRGSERLLAFLALAGTPVERATVAYRLWPDKPEPRAVANLRSALWRIRALAGDLVEVTNHRLRLHPAVWVDARDGLAERPERLALEGELLPDWYDDWLLTERQRLRQVRLHALEVAVEGLIEGGELPAAIDLGLRAVALEPLRESAHRLVIRAHLAEGNRWEAVRQYEACARLLRHELGLAPSPQMAALLS